MPPAPPLRVAINAQLPTDGRSGGIEQFVLALVRSLGRVDDADVEFTIVGPASGAGEFGCELGPNQRLVPYVRPGRRPLAQRALRRARRLASRPLRDDFFDVLGVDVVHFPYQGFVPCATPTVFNPHDLQHRHYPEFFGERDLAVREAIFATGCRHATALVAASDWGCEDLVAQYGVPSAKVLTIRQGAPTGLYDDVPAAFVDDVRARLSLPDAFALYPAQTWPHKNHLTLVEAVARLRDRHDARVDVICTGAQNKFWPTIEERIRELGVADRVRFLGYLPPQELKALYRLATFVVFPSLFEGGGLPVVEAFHEDVALACSSSTGLPEYAGDGALVFDPRSVDAVADALLTLSRDDALRARLRAVGRQRAELFTWQRAADEYVALYRRLARDGAPIQAEASPAAAG
jgi:glycosyltransferase involved in cell wall biosynthesis